MDNKTKADNPGNLTTLEHMLADETTKPMVLRAHIAARLYYQVLTGKSKKMSERLLGIIFAKHGCPLRLLDDLAANYANSHTIDLNNKEPAIENILSDYERITAVKVKANTPITTATLLSSSMVALLEDAQSQSAACTAEMTPKGL